MEKQKFFGVGKIKILKNILSKNKAKNIFLVTGRESYKKCGAETLMADALKGYQIIHFHDFCPNPELPDLRQGIKTYHTRNIDIVLAIGGGSVMDMAKLINIFAIQSGTPLIYLQKKKRLRGRGKPLIAVPTTAGSGSEATRFAVISINKIKYSLDDQRLVPDYAIVDPQFTFNLPAKITAETGMDALSQAIESYWSIYANQQSKQYAKHAIKLIMKNFKPAVRTANARARIAMSRAAYLAGQAINITRTTACHSISYPITAYFNVAHGQAVGLTLGEMLVYNSLVTAQDALDKRGVDYVKKTISELVDLLGADSPVSAAKKINNLMKNVGLATTLTQLGIKTEKDLAVIIKNGFNPDRVNNNPRLLTKDDLKIILNNQVS